MKNTIRAKGFGFAVRRGLIDIGRNYRIGRWVIELRYTCPYFSIPFYRLWVGKSKPSPRCIIICTILSPIALLLHWLVVVPSVSMVFASIAAAIVATSVLGAVLGWLGARLEWLLPLR